MVGGIGCDIIEIERVKEVVRKHPDTFLKRHFTDRERDYFARYRDPSPQIAGRFAAKEAIAKALGLGFGDRLTWLDIEILPDSLGKPIATLSSSFLSDEGTFHLEVSISHAKEYAMAIAQVIS